jgi:hypothetical protein
VPFIKLIIAFSISVIGFGLSQIPQPAEPVFESESSAPYQALGGFGQAMADIYRPVPPVTTTTSLAPVYRHGDCSWLPALALASRLVCKANPTTNEVRATRIGLLS